MNDDNRICAVRRHVLNQIVAESVCQRRAVETLRCIGIDEDKAGFGVDVGRIRIFRLKVPPNGASILRDAIGDGVEGTNHV